MKAQDTFSEKVINQKILSDSVTKGKLLYLKK